MRMNRHTGLALGLIFFGGVILLDKLGIHLGHHIMEILFPAIMVGLGFIGLKNGRNLIGWILIGVGGMILFANMSGLIAIAAAVGLIWYGISLLRRKGSAY